MSPWIQILTRSVLLKIVFLLLLWIGTLWVYFRWKFKKERSVLPPERSDS